MTDPRITCPHCHTEIKLTESLAAPLIAETRASYEQKLKSQQDELAAREQEVLKRQTEVAHAQANVETMLAERLQTERQSLIEQGKKLASSTHEFDMAQQAEQLKLVQATLKEREDKLAEAQKQQAEFMQKSRALDDKMRELDVAIEKRVNENLEAVRAKSKADSEEESRLKLAERDEKIASMARQLVEMQRKVEQGSQQLQGEVLELDFERELAARFPLDVIEPVAKGELGADLLQRVYTKQGQLAGTIIWETKRTKHWSDGWLAKLRDDQRMAHADIAILVSAVLPKGVEHFDLVEGVYTVHPRTAFALATTLRQSILEIARTRVSQQGQATKVDEMYAYLTGSVFRHRVEALLSNYTAIQDGFNKEKSVLMKQWKKRDKQLSIMLEATTAMFGEMQAIAGKDLTALPVFDLDALAEGADDEG